MGLDRGQLRILSRRLEEGERLNWLGVSGDADEGWVLEIFLKKDGNNKRFGKGEEGEGAGEAAGTGTALSWVGKGKMSGGS